MEGIRVTYLMSDLHGQYDKYKKMLETIRFSRRDDLYILGDVADRGPEPVRLLRDMSLRINVFPILGNHDWTARVILSRLNEEITEENAQSGIAKDFLDAVRLWLSDGGDTTFEEFRRLDPEAREVVLDYLGEFVPYEEITVNGTRYVLVHAGLKHFSPDKPLEDYDELDLCDGRTDYGRRYFRDRILVTGHTPTLHIDPAFEGRIWRGNGHIALDCGAGFGLPLGCLRLEDGAEFYAE